MVTVPPYEHNYKSDMFPVSLEQFKLHDSYDKHSPKPTGYSHPVFSHYQLLCCSCGMWSLSSGKDTIDFLNVAVTCDIITAYPELTVAMYEYYKKLRPRMGAAPTVDDPWNLVLKQMREVYCQEVRLPIGYQAKLTLKEMWNLVRSFSLLLYSEFPL